jgi:hypothetical protein
MVFSICGRKAFWGLCAEQIAGIFIPLPSGLMLERYVRAGSLRMESPCLDGDVSAEA